MNKAQKRRHEQDMHALRITRAATLAHIQMELKRWNNTKVREMYQVLDGVQRALVEGYETGRIVSTTVELYDSNALPEFLEQIDGDPFDGLGDFTPRLSPEHQKRVEEELRRQQESDEPYPF